MEDGFDIKRVLNLNGYNTTPHYTYIHHGITYKIKLDGMFLALKL
jgi:hypothetical protein